MFSRKKKIILSLFAFLLLAIYQNIAAPHILNPEISTKTEVQGAQDAKIKAEVVRVIDGDTVEILLDNEKIKVRVIGIDTPESVDPRRPVECFGKEASDYAKQLLTGQHVFLESDSTQTERDKYGRLLRYIWIGNGSVDFGREMITKGYAYEFTYDAPYKYREEYKRAQNQARETGQGLWKTNVCSPSPSLDK